MPLDTSRVEALFHAAQQIAPDDRRVWLETACAGDETLRSRVEALLSAADDASRFLQKPAVELTGAQHPEVTVGFDGSSVNAAGGSSVVRLAKSSEEALSFLQPTDRSDSLGKLGHYEVLEVIGQGGFGIVLRAFDEKLHRVVALKVLAPELAANGSARKRFIREARTAAAVKNEHVVSIYGVEENAQPPYLAMEMIDGKSLQDKIDQQGPLTLTEILRIGLQMSEGLAAAHKQGLVHRDIKPANILLENGVERVKITDFGLARAVDDASVTQSGAVAGTPMYMSPEQAEGLAIDHRSDLFSLGTVLYAMCTGHSAFRASGTHAVLKRVIEAASRPIREVNQDVPDWLCDIIAKLHAKRPEDRFQSAKEVAELLGQHLAHLQQPNRTPRPAAIVVPAHKDEQQPDKILSGSIALLSTVRTIIVYGVVISCVVFLGTWFLGWHIRSVVRVGSVLFGLLVLASVCLAIIATETRREQWARALQESAIAFGVLTFSFGMVAFNEWLSPIPDLIPVPAVLSIEFNDPKIQFRIDGHGANQTAVSNFQVPLEPGEHYVWLKLDDVELQTSSFPILAGQHASLEVSIIESTAAAKLNGKLIPMRQLAGPAVGVQLEGGRLALPGTLKWPPDFTPKFKDDKERMQGVWQAVALSMNGEPAPDAMVSETSVAFEGSTMRVTMPGGREDEGTFYFTETDLPKKLDVIGKDQKGRYGIYRFDADVGAETSERLVICMGEEKERPTEFKSVKGTTRIVVTCKRAAALGSGFVPLFNGKDLTGWKSIVPNGMTWTWADGVLTAKGRGDLVVTDRNDYENFHLRMSIKCNLDGGAAVRLRNADAMYGDRYLTGIGRENNSNTLGGGGLKVFRENKPVELARNVHVGPADQWHTLEIIATDNRWQTFVDGKPVADVTDPEKTRLRGSIALSMLHKDPQVVHFRDVEIKELPPTPAETGFVPLLNGKDLAGWKVSPGGDSSNWTWQEGVLTAKGQREILVTERSDFENFHLRLAIKSKIGSGARVGFRTADGMEGGGYVTAIRSFSEMSEHFGGGLTLRLGEQETSLAKNRDVGPGDQWYTLEIIAIGNRFQTLVNGKPFADVTDPKNTLARGGIMLGLWGTSAQEVHFKDVEIKELPAAEAKDTAEVKALREANAAQERNRELVRRQVEAAIVSPLALVQAECDWIDAKVRLAEAQQSGVEVVSLLKELVTARMEERGLVAKQFEAGTVPATAVNAVHSRLADAKVRLARAEAAIRQ